MLPNSAANLERFEWLATSIRKYSGDASVVKVHSIDNLSAPQLSRRFNHARDKDYEELTRELQKFSSAAHRKRAAARL